MSGSAGKLERLEQLRGAASFYVFVHHYVRHNLPEAPGLARFFVFGQVAVLLFFLLSGFVIHYSANRRRDLSARDYFIRRFRRIYPVFALALLLSYLAACVKAGSWIGADLRSLGLNLLQLQGLDRSPGQWVDCYMGNEPLWSLSYEWWFYVLFFGVFVGTRDKPQVRAYWALGISALGFVSDVVWPNPLSLVASYFVLWWVGAELATQWVKDGKITLRGQSKALLGAGLVTAAWGVYAVLVARQAGAFDAYHHPGITARHFVTTMVVVAVGWGWMRMRGVGLNVLLRPFGAIAPFSYALYVMHLPFVFIAKTVSTGWGVLDFLWITPTLFALCWAIEQPLQRQINRVLR